MNKHSHTLYAALSCIALCLATGCQEYEGPLAEHDATEVLKNFSFELSHSVNLDIDYGSLSSRAYVEVYGEDPLAQATADDQSPKGEPLYTTFLDENGSFHGTMNIPTCVDHVYIYSPAWGTPMLMDCEIKDRRAMVSSVPFTWPTTRALTRGSEGYEILALKEEEVSNTNKKYFTINGGWNNYGKTNNENHLIDEGTLSANVIAGLQKKLWGDEETKGAAKTKGTYTGSKYRVANVNVDVLEQYTDENGVVYDVNNATVWFTMLTEAAWNENTFGYYYYTKGKFPGLDNVNKYIVLPNVSISGDAPFGVKGNNYYFGSQAPAYTNMRVKLLYRDENGNVSDKFPPNTEIGFFILSDAFHAPSVTKETIDGKEYDVRSTRQINASKGYISSNSTSVNSSRYIALQLPDNSLAYGVEDGSDSSYDDMLFTVSADPNLSIHTNSELAPDSDIEPVEDKDTTKPLYTHTYAFEDIWPKGGDYDLNDVVVEHKRTYTYNQFNFVKQVVDVFTIRSIADHTDGFAIQIEPGRQGKMTLPEGAVFEEETNSVILTKQVQNGQSLTLIRELNGINKADIDNEEINPYIINYTLTTDDDQRIEVHLPGLNVTSKGKTIGEGNSDYYLDYTTKFPFAIRLPIGGFNLCPEGVRIDKYYPEYTGWTESKGANNTDWFKHPVQQ